MARLISALVILACTFGGVAGVPDAARAADFYAGKTLTMIVGNDVGGGFDAYARLFSRHLQRVIPGHPTVVVQNMPGAGSATAAAFVSRVAAKDGTFIGVLTPGAIVGPLFEEHGHMPYDPAKFIYLTSADSGSRLCVTYQSAKVKTVADAKEFKAIIGTASVGSSSSDYAKLHRATSGLKFELVAGYKGTGDLLLAMERGEIDGFCGVDWSSLTSQRPNWLRDHQVNLLFQVGVKPNPELAALNVPEASASTTSPENRAVLDLVTAQQVFSRPYIMAPGNPKEAVGILRAAFGGLYNDPQFIADAERSKLMLAPASGAEVQDSVERLYQAPQAVVDKARDVLK
ncbi:MAG: efflux transporter protein [Hyphomicrobiales bacterium]|nr:efflux transporter protein [Hyphomicrobiales bacterium]